MKHQQIGNSRECTCGFKASGAGSRERFKMKPIDWLLKAQREKQQLELLEHIAAMTAAAKPKRRSKLQAKGPAIDPDGLFRDNLGESPDV